MDQDGVKVHKSYAKKSARSISSHPDRTSVVNNVFIRFKIYRTIVIQAK